MIIMISLLIFNNKYAEPNSAMTAADNDASVSSV